MAVYRQPGGDLSVPDPYWNSAVIDQVNLSDIAQPVTTAFCDGVWLGISIMVFSFNWPIVSSFVVSKREE